MKNFWNSELFEVCEFRKKLNKKWNRKNDNEKKEIKTQRNQKSTAEKTQRTTLRNVKIGQPSLSALCISIAIWCNKHHIAFSLICIAWWAMYLVKNIKKFTNSKGSHIWRKFKYLKKSLIKKIFMKWKIFMIFFKEFTYFRIC